MTSVSNYGNLGLKDSYTFDDRGNITGKITTNASTGASVSSVQYRYSTAETDQLTHYYLYNANGTLVDERLYQYDGEGNVSRIMDTNNQYIAFGWDQGRKMTRYRYVDVDNTYYYNESGLVSKLVKSDGSSIEYFYDDGQLEYEEYRNAAGNVTRLHKFFYDDDGIVRYLMTTVYPSYGEYFSDVYAYVYDGSGNITDLVCMKKNMRTQGSYFGAVHSVHYEYDAYGRIVSETNVSGEDIIDYNPIKYKGYYYENDTKMYRLDSRYYDPAIGRFINADNISLLTETPTALTDKNLYSYCDNNPVMRKDSEGEIWGPLIGAAIGVGFEITFQVATEGKVSNLSAVCLAGVTGAVGASSAGLLVQVGINAAASVGQLIIDNKKANKKTDLANVAKASFLGGVTGFIGGKGANIEKNVKNIKVLTKKIAREDRRKNTKHAGKRKKIYRRERSQIRRGLRISFGRYCAAFAFSKASSRR